MRLKWKKAVESCFGICLAVVCLTGTASAQPAGLHTVLSRPILGEGQTTVEVQVHTASKVPIVHVPNDSADWIVETSRLRQELLDKVYLRGETRRWAGLEASVEWLESISRPGYRVRKFRYEAIPGLWIPALLYEPEELSGKVPLVLNVNGHEATGMATPYIQERCINLAKRGIVAMNFEWPGRGQLNSPGFNHYRANQLDLCGTSSVGIHYLVLKRAIDLLVAHEHADPERLAVTGLSGGGWQTITISALDPRVALANPVAGYSSFVTRTQFPTLDLGDSEQTPPDLATVADYTHLTAMVAPRPLLLTYNSRDNCCFRADYALGPLMSSARPIFDLFGGGDTLRYHLNYDAGHNYGRDNREAFYNMLRKFFFSDSSDFPVEDLPVGEEVLTGDELLVSLPDDNLDFHQLALKISRVLPKSPPRPREKEAFETWRDRARAELARLVRVPKYDVLAKRIAGSVLPNRDTVIVSHWQLRMGGSWTVPVVEMDPSRSKSTVIVLADGGRSTAISEVEERLSKKERVVAIDPFYFGESTITPRDFLFALLVSAVGDRPLGIQAGQISAVARWLHARGLGPVRVVALGPRTSLAAAVASAIEADGIQELELHESLGSLAEIIEQNLSAREAPELFSFGLIEQFDIEQILALSIPRRLTVVNPTLRAQGELTELREYYDLMGVSHDPLRGRE